MREATPPWKHGVVLVCTNERAPGAPKPSCGRVRGSELRDRLKKDLRKAGGPGGLCRVLGTTCLDVCPADGVAVALEPGGRVIVADPEADYDALVKEIQAHAQKLADAEAGGESGEGGGRGLLSRIKSRVRGD